MRIGILSMQRVPNYGSYWQARCLKNIFEKKGYIVEFIDIKKGRNVLNNIYHAHFSLSKVKKIPFYYHKFYRNKMFHKAQIRELKCFEQYNYKENYDLIIIGSDEVFNFAQTSKWGFSPQIFGLMNNSNICTYAASFGFSTYEDICVANIQDEITSCLLNIRNISVRDNNSYEIMHKLLPNKTINLNFDPVIIGDIDVYRKKENNVDYILIYAYDFRFDDEAYIKKIKQIAKEKKLKVYSVGFYQTWCDKNIFPKPENIFEWFLNAKYIITDTFHGTIFSMRMHKKFATIVRESNKNKLEDLIERCGMKGRLVANADDLTKIIEEEIDYSKFELIRDKERKKAITYLEECLDYKDVNTNAIVSE